MAAATIDFRNPQYYINRELSWLEFDRRCLSEARNKENPLFERLKFLSITASNLDEFFQVRVASLQDMVNAGYKKKDIAGMSASEQLTAVLSATQVFMQQQYYTLNRQLIPALEEQGLVMVRDLDTLSKSESRFVEEYFSSNVFPVLTPMAVDSSRPFPLIRNKSLNIGALLVRKETAAPGILGTGKKAKKGAKAGKAPIIYCLGVTEHTTGTEGVMSLSNLALVTGKMGRSGCGVNPLRGQNNVQGACDMGALPTDYTGYQKVDNDAVREKFEKAWGVKLSPKPGLKATEVFPAAIAGKIKGLYICGEDPIVSDPDTTHVEKALKSLDFLVIQDLFMTKTAEYADVILPAVSYAEKEGTFTNTERRVQRIRKAVTVPGDMRNDIDIITDLMNAMGYPQKRVTSAEVMDEIAALTPSFHGISHARLDAGESLQWPCPEKDHPGTPIMHVGGPTRGKALLFPAPYTPAAELPDEEYPFILSTGRILYHYNAGSMTMRSAGLRRISGEGFIEMNEKDAERLGIENGERIIVRSRRGAIEVPARVGNKVSEGETWMPFHFPDAPVNRITNSVFDEYARIPEYKVLITAQNSFKVSVTGRCGVPKGNLAGIFEAVIRIMLA